MGALSRCGADPLSQLNYTLLRAICDDPKNLDRRALMRHVPQIDASRLSPWRALRICLYQRQNSAFLSH